MNVLLFREILGEAVPVAPHDGEDRVGANREDVEQKEKKKLLICESHAIVDPGAMVIHFDHTPAAEAAGGSEASEKVMRGCPMSIPAVVSAVRLVAATVRTVFNNGWYWFQWLSGHGDRTGVG